MNLHNVFGTVIVAGKAEVIHYQIEAADAADAVARFKFVLPDDVRLYENSIRTSPVVPVKTRTKDALDKIIAA